MSYMKQKRKQTLENAQYGLEIIFKQLHTIIRMLMRYWLKLYNTYIETMQENCGMNDTENAKAIETI